MSEIIKDHLVSALQTFLATFFSVIGASLASGHIEFTGAFVGALALTAVRAGVKAMFQKWAPPALGGLKKKSA